MTPTGFAIFNAAAFPLIIAAALVFVLLVRSVIVPAIRCRELTLMHHGLPIALALLVAADLTQTIYYTYARLFPDADASAWNWWPPLILIRLLVLSGSIVAIATYARIVGWRLTLLHVIAIACAVWALGVALLML